MSERDASPALLLDRYRTDAVIGEGAFGRVVRAYDTRLKRSIAIKTLKRSMARTDLGQFRLLEDRFVREAEAGARVGNHSNLVTVYDLVQDEEQSLHLLLQYVPGGTIAERITSAGPFALEGALHLVTDIARGLHAAHEAGIVHRDIKPANIFLAEDGRALVGDFGIAQLDHLSARTYAVIGHPGTPLYMSPEQANSTGYVRPTSDQYSVGLVFFEMLHGQPYKRLWTREVEEFLATLPMPVRALFERMTAFEPEERYRTMADVMVAIRRVQQSVGLDTVAPIAPARDAPVPPPDRGMDRDPSEHPAGLISPYFVPPEQTPDAPRAPSAPPASPSRVPLTPPPGLSGDVAPSPVVEAPSAEPPSVRIVPGSHGVEPPLALDPPVAAVAEWNTPPDIPGGSPPVARPSDVYANVIAVPTARRSRIAFVVGGFLALLLIAGVTGALLLNGSRGGGLATATAPVSGGGEAATTTAAPATASPTGAGAILTPLLASPTPYPTVTVAPAATQAQPIAATPAPTTAPTAAPTATPAPSLGVFGVGTTDRGDLETLTPADAASTFTVGQEVFVFVNYDGARPGVDRFDIAVIGSGAALPARNVTVQKPGGFVFVSLGKPAAGTYRIEVRHDGALLPNQATFEMKAPAPTAVPAVPRVIPTTGGAAPPPVSQPKSPTCVPGTC